MVKLQNIFHSFLLIAVSSTNIAFSRTEATEEVPTDFEQKRDMYVKKFRKIQKEYKDKGSMDQLETAERKIKILLEKVPQLTEEEMKKQLKTRGFTEKNLKNGDIPETDLMESVQKAEFAVHSKFMPYIEMVAEVLGLTEEEMILIKKDPQYLQSIRQAMEAILSLQDDIEKIKSQKDPFVAITLAQVLDNQLKEVDLFHEHMDRLKKLMELGNKATDKNTQKHCVLSILQEKLEFTTKSSLRATFMFKILSAHIASNTVDNKSKSATFDEVCETATMLQQVTLAQQMDMMTKMMPKQD